MQLSLNSLKIFSTVHTQTDFSPTFQDHLPSPHLPSLQAFSSEWQHVGQRGGVLLPGWIHTCGSPLNTLVPPFSSCLARGCDGGEHPRPLPAGSGCRRLREAWRTSMECLPPGGHKLCRSSLGLSQQTQEMRCCW